MVKPEKKKTGKKDNTKRFSNLFENTPRNYRIGGHVMHKRDLTRFVKWPQYVV